MHNVYVDDGGTHVCHDAHMDVNGQLYWVCSLFIFTWVPGTDFRSPDSHS